MKKKNTENKLIEYYAETWRTLDAYDKGFPENNNLTYKMNTPSSTDLKLAKKKLEDAFINLISESIPAHKDNIVKLIMKLIEK